MISISVLGPVELHRDGVAVPVRPGKTTELLVRLALEAGVMVRTERLIEDLWADEAVGIARNPLQTKVSRLRRSLGDGSLVTGTRAGYTLNVAPEAVDAIEVLRLAGEAATARVERSRSRRSRSARRRWRCSTATFSPTPATANGSSRTVSGSMRPASVSSRIGSRRSSISVVPARSSPRSKPSCSSHPLRERLWVSLITALYRSGRQADALGAYARVRETLVEQLGLEPGPALRALEQQVLLQDPALDGVRLPGRTGSSHRRSHLPALTSPMTGRDADLDCRQQTRASMNAW